MSAPLLARLMLTTLAAGQGISPLFIDLSRTHATNPHWPGHARFHVVWQSFALALAAVIEVALIWMSGPSPRQRFYLAALLTAIPMIAFFIAMFVRRIYAGTLHDPNGIQPLRIRTSGGILEIDMNAALVIIGSAVLVLSVLVF